MDEEVFNLDLRKFLKKFGVTAQREIEKAVQNGLERGDLRGDETIHVEATLSLGPLLPALRGGAGLGGLRGGERVGRGGGGGEDHFLKVFDVALPQSRSSASP